LHVVDLPHEVRGRYDRLGPVGFQQRQAGALRPGDRLDRELGDPDQSLLQHLVPGQQAGQACQARRELVVMLVMGGDAGTLTSTGQPDPAPGR